MRGCLKHPLTGTLISSAILNTVSGGGGIKCKFSWSNTSGSLIAQKKFEIFGEFFNFQVVKKEPKFTLNSFKLLVLSSISANLIKKEKTFAVHLGSYSTTSKPEISQISQMLPLLVMTLSDRWPARSESCVSSETITCFFSVSEKAYDLRGNLTVDISAVQTDRSYSRWPRNYSSKRNGLVFCKKNAPSPVWITLVIGRPLGDFTSRPSPDTTPMVSVWSSPKGFPMANANWPTWNHARRAEEGGGGVNKADSKYSPGSF